MSGFSAKSCFSTCSTDSSSSTSSTSSSSSQSSFNNSKIAWLSSVEVEAAMEKEKKLILEEMLLGRNNFSTTQSHEGTGRKDWKRSVGPNTGRKLGKILSKSTSTRSLRISGPIHLQPLDDSSTSYNRTPPLSSATTGTTRSSSFKWFF